MQRGILGLEEQNYECMKRELPTTKKISQTDKNILNKRDRSKGRNASNVGMTRSKFLELCVRKVCFCTLVLVDKHLARAVVERETTQFPSRTSSGAMKYEPA